MVVISIKCAPSRPLFKLLQFSVIYGHVNEMHIFNATARMHSLLLVFTFKKMFQAFGMTETTGGHTIGNEKEFRLEAAGRKREGVHSKIVNPDEDQQGEVRDSFPLMLCYVKGI
jgi:acyl-CoA synthetase (AMP-forming)/AMP-acid ligase II